MKIKRSRNYETSQSKQEICDFVLEILTLCGSYLEKSFLIHKLSCSYYGSLWLKFIRFETVTRGEFEFRNRLMPLKCVVIRQNPNLHCFVIDNQNLINDAFSFSLTQVLLGC